MPQDLLHRFSFCELVFQPVQTANPLHERIFDLLDAHTLFRVLAAPTRRRILDLLAEREALTVGELAAEFPDLVASGISKHLLELRDVGLVHATRQGRQRVYRIEGTAFTEALAPWLARYETYWIDALERLRHLAEDSDPAGSG